ncbi:flagellar basal-body rod modification protein FlgD [Psychrobacillus insolitus]|uniref:Basal-body rod modification protein FlgD n=1 Tax=Psychrobacillus insolitus TaxID=1461 RepID=A0A2W7N754_9BACI|nr:flagellar hook assembly protein FlgD [Psychrobacillus insolitus]PZX07863.1 flagellar basal-body rod modification protein FlgD [Psychrobacillus insolitus]
MAEMTAITDSMYLSSKKAPTKTTGNSNLGKDAFLKILMTQLQNQDPTKPMDDSQFIAQMAQFSSLEQMTNLTTAFEKFAEAQEQTQMIEYSNFVGKDVKWHELTEELDADGKPLTNEGTGAITGVKFLEGNIEFTLDGGKVITPGNISEVLSSSTSSNSLVEASMMIGKTVSYSSDNGEVSGQVESVSKKDGNIVFNLSELSISADQINSIK